MNPKKSMKLSRFLLAGAVLSTVGAAFGYHHLAIKAKSAQTTAVSDQMLARPTLPANTVSPHGVAVNTDENNASASHLAAQVKTGELTELLDQVIADAIQRGTLDQDRLTPQQLALLPEKFRKKKNSEEPQLSPEEIAHIEQQIALGDAAPPDPPPQLPCPDPNHLPENYDNDYNKMILRQRGCTL